MLQYSLIRWVGLLLYSLQPVSFPQQILMPGEPKSEEACIGVLFWVILIKLHLVAHLDFGLEFLCTGVVGGCSKHTFKHPRISPPLPTPHAYHIHVEEQMGSSPTGCPVFLVTKSSSPSHKFAGALGSSSSSLLSGHPGPLFDRTVMVVKYPNNQGGTQSPSLCRKAISLLARYERRQIRLGEGNMFLV